MVVIDVDVDVSNHGAAHAVRAVHVLQVHHDGTLVAVLVEDFLCRVFCGVLVACGSCAGALVGAGLLSAFVDVVLEARVIAQANDLDSCFGEAADRLIEARVDSFVVRACLGNGGDEHHGLRLTLENFLGHLGVEFRAFVAGVDGADRVLAATEQVGLQVGFGLFCDGLEDAQRLFGVGGGCQ